MRLGDGQVETACPTCGAKWDCMCKCRERIRLSGKEMDAMVTVIDVARFISESGNSEEARTLLTRALAVYDAATSARESAP